MSYVWADVLLTIYISPERNKTHFYKATCRILSVNSIRQKTKQLCAGSDRLFRAALVIFSGRDAPIQPLIYHLLALKIAPNHLKMLKVKLQKPPKYSHFRILLKAAERLGIFSIPVRVTKLKRRRTLIKGVRLFYALVQFIKADTLFAVLVVEQNNDFIVI